MARLGSLMFMAIAPSMMLTQGVLGEIVCQNLPTGLCTFAISSTGMRCVLERFVQGSELQLQCRTSQVPVAGNVAGWIETDRCVDACGVDRSWVGISSDSLMDAKFLERLCATPCFEGCPNIVELYYNLAAAEGAFLPNLCEALKTSSRRWMESIFDSNSIAAPPSSSTPAPREEKKAGHHSHHHHQEEHHQYHHHHHKKHHKHH